jgi:hypothetical protein
MVLSIRHVDALRKEVIAYVVCDVNTVIAGRPSVIDSQIADTPASVRVLLTQSWPGRRFSTGPTLRLTLRKYENQHRRQISGVPD